MNKNRLPQINNKKRVCIICEGSEEFEYLTKLKGLKVWNNKYEILPENAEGNGNIFARYQDKYQNGSSDIILVFCDTEKKPYEQYDDIKKKINEFHGLDIDNRVIDEIVIFANPCTMQIILLHWEQVILKTNSKRVNAPIIERLTGVKEYKGKLNQREELFSRITVENYDNMIVGVRELPEDDKCIGSSNFKKLIEYISNEDDSWIEDINYKLL